MTPRRPGRKRRVPSGNTVPSPPPSLPAWKAFVVQFSHDAGTEIGHFSGRVEHLSSGRRKHFESEKELLTALRQLLKGVGPPLE